MISVKELPNNTQEADYSETHGVGKHKLHVPSYSAPGLRYNQPEIYGAIGTAFYIYHLCSDFWFGTQLTFEILEEIFYLIFIFCLITAH